jgi:hypothetical protein
MPTYQNNSATERYLLDPGKVLIEPQAAVAIDHYLGLGDNTDVVMISHEPVCTPFELIATVSSFPSAEIDVSGYEVLYVYNNTYASVFMQVNGSSDFSIGLTTYLPITLRTKGKIGTMQFESEDNEGGDLYIVGFFEEDTLINGYYYIQQGG